MHQCKTNLHAIAAVAVIPRHAGYNPPKFFDRQRSCLRLTGFL